MFGTYLQDEWKRCIKPVCSGQGEILEEGYQMVPEKGSSMKSEIQAIVVNVRCEIVCRK